MEQEVEYFVPASNGYPYSVYGQRVGDMEENTKGRDGGHEALSILNFKLNKLHVLLHISTCKL